MNHGKPVSLPVRLMDVDDWNGGRRMSELQDDLNLFSGGLAPDPGSPLANIVDAARRYANLDIEALARLLADHQGVDWADEDYMPALRRLARQYANAALGVTTEDNA